MLKLDRSCLDVQIYMSSFDGKYFIQVEVYWFQQSTAADSLRRTRPREPKFGWYFSKHFLYKISYRRVITPPVFSFTVNFPRLICHHWTGTGAICQMANKKKEEGISHCSLTLFSRQPWKWNWSPACPWGAPRLLSSWPGHSSASSPCAANGGAGGSQGTSWPHLALPSAPLVILEGFS